MCVEPDPDQGQTDAVHADLRPLLVCTDTQVMMDAAKVVGEQESLQNGVKAD